VEGLLEIATDLPAWSRERNEDCKAALLRFVLARDRLVAAGHPAAASEKIRRLDDKIDHFGKRCGLRRSRWLRLPVVARELSSRRYGRYSQGTVSALNDLVRSISGAE
jgi:hypothetical protein